MRRWTRCGGAVLAAAAIGIGACGDSDDTPTSGSASGSGTGSSSGAGGEGDAHDEHGAHGSGDKAAFAAADADTTVDVTMRDFAFSGIPATVMGEKVLFEVSNEGPSEHEFVVFKQGGDDAVSGIEPFAEGKTENLAVELAPGSYTVRCLIQLGDQTHAELGMQTDFTVG
jgi:uncharacterized cupredoxin-like copper-binding protein